jgi:hypothetical protein
LLPENNELESGEDEVSSLIAHFSGLVTDLGDNEFKSDDLTTSSDIFLDKFMSEWTAIASPVLPFDGSKTES